MHLTENECLDLHAYVLDKLAPATLPSDISFARTDWSDYSDEKKYINKCAMEWYDSFSRSDVVLHRQPSDHATGFPLPEILKTSLIRFNTGNCGVFLNPIRASNWEAKKYSPAKVHTPTTLSTAHSCNCRLDMGKFIKATRNTETGGIRLTTSLAVRTCSGALRFLEPSPDVGASFNEAFEAVCQDNPQTIASVAGWRNCSLPENLVNAFAEAGQAVFWKLGLRKDCSKFPNDREDRSMIWQSEEFAPPDEDQTNKEWLEQVLVNNEVPRGHTDSFRTMADRVMTHLKTQKPLTDMASTERNHIARVAVETAIAQFSSSELLRDGSTTSVQIHTEIDVVPFCEVPRDDPVFDDPSSKDASIEDPPPHFFRFSTAVTKLSDDDPVTGPPPPEVTEPWYLPTTTSTWGSADRVSD
jgi:hypothetical protein